MPLLSAQNVHKTYRLGRVDVPVLHGVSLDVEKGESLAILGASGSGKSTLLHLLGGLDRPDKGKDRTGQIVFQGRALRDLSARELDRYRAASVGFVFQFYHLLPELSVLDNVVIGAMVRYGWSYWANKSASIHRAGELLAAFGLGHRLKHRPAELSGGERQRVAIARALINQPAVLLADEPTGNLDRATGAKILDALAAIRQQRSQTMVIVTHDPEVAARADRVVRLQDGHVIPANSAPRPPAIATPNAPQEPSPSPRSPATPPAAAC
jgi:lipoprotein-releasing system ATP-binding protein